jgi:hypothetical protein
MPLACHFPPLESGLSGSASSCVSQRSNSSSRCCQAFRAELNGRSSPNHIALPSWLKTRSGCMRGHAGQSTPLARHFPCREFPPRPRGRRPQPRRACMQWSLQLPIGARFVARDGAGAGRSHVDDAPPHARFTWHGCQPSRRSSACSRHRRRSSGTSRPANRGRHQILVRQVGL